MPDVKVRHPRGLFIDTDAKASFMDEVTSAVAMALDCNDRDDNPTNLTEEHVDLMLRPYDPEDARIGVLILVEIAAYDYPDRMDDIDERLRIVQGNVAQAVRRVCDVERRFPGINKIVSVSFFPMGEDTWA